MTADHEQSGELMNTPVNGATDTAVNGAGSGGEVIPLPFTAGPSAVEPVAEVYDAEILSEEESAAVSRRLAAQTVARRSAAVAVRSAGATVRAVRVVGTSPQVTTAGLAAARAAVTAGQGVRSWVVRAWDAATLGVYRRQVRAAELVGDRVSLAEWTDRKEQAAERRHQRLLDLPRLAAGIIKASVGTVAGLVVLVLLVALLAQLSSSGSFTGVVSGVLAAVRWTFHAAVVVWTPFTLCLPLVVVAAAWREGRRRGSPPRWLATTAEADTDAAVDETTIARALEALRIPQIRDYLKAGTPLQFLTPARRDGRGTHAVVRLPHGVPAERIAQRRADLATGLHRLAKEVWPTTGAEAGILDLWVADKGALAEGAGPYPLLDAGTCDVFKGVPFGRTLRGDPIVAPVIGCNTITGGMPNQGKSTAARAVVAGCALDPTVELRIWVPDANFDFEAFRPRCSRYVMGADDEKIAQICDHLRELHAEVQARGELLVAHEEPAVTRALADAGIGLHPLVCLLEEAHVAIQHKAHGPEISELLVSIVKLGRKRGIHLIVSTQAPTKDSMPRDVTRNCSNGIAFAVGDHVANDALLGQGAYTAGHRATELIPGTDRGTCVVKGFTGERSAIVQVYFLDVSRGHDQVTPIIRRAMAAIAEHGPVPGSASPTPRAEAPRDLLDDLDAVLGTDPVPAADVPALLARHAPRWAPYRRLTGKALREVLAAEHDVSVPSTGNRWPIDPATVRHALARRATTDLDDGA
ncbi:MAG TPA: hypothetical protein VLJ59_08010 [Mycobacteriales bacterium]|nr:hypothetical protein [Mycobacteriales bacterium]